ncbi:hypothetical protein A2841_03145 [Candidatus Kaiserbacteria bacterium RIFCSPHIGHO2_01_FULL_48_10]|uniref:Uncharacterized protein n=1 Tax=Candidatus Kaiserbacteria bacterium RIFCSPHIGHO2_01_FULL_48_10 TaxID=1798476 RepID=A0A1F6C1I7_9BACT|nr:MAG: hypothetical protein A2841_03145 [Candidatus Kaiserbacteria bacterium RIFCSPHIGHO2_01_FULL_48_10]
MKHELPITGESRHSEVAASIKKKRRKVFLRKGLKAAPLLLQVFLIAEMGYIGWQMSKGFDGVNDSLQTLTTTMETGLSDVRESIVTLKDSLTDRFTRIDESLKRIENRLDTIDARKQPQNPPQTTNPKREAGS